MAVKEKCHSWKFWHPCKNGAGTKNTLFLRFFCGTHICVEHDAKNEFIYCVLLYFFCGQQHLVPGIKYFRKSLGFVRYFESVSPTQGGSNIVDYESISPTLRATKNC